MAQFGHSLKCSGIALIDLSAAAFSGLEPYRLTSVINGEVLDTVCNPIFSRSGVLLRHFRDLPTDAAETGFYSFPLNSNEGNVRGSTLHDSYAGLPRSMIWNHCATENPVIPEFGIAQGLLDDMVCVYRQITQVVIDALSIYLKDYNGLLRNLVGQSTHHRANYIKLICSRGAAGPTELRIDSLTGMVCRHRVHVDHCVLTVCPPTRRSFIDGGRLFYLCSAPDGQSWYPLEVPIGHIAIFGGVDLATFTRGTPIEISGLPHQVLATPQEAQRARNSVLFRLAIDPDSTALHPLSGAAFSFHGIPTASGEEFYRAVLAHRRGY